MKIFLSESIPDYTSYTFNYAIYCKQEKEEETDEIYRKGFLPYSNSLQLNDPHFYLARSLRVHLADFKETSENRRLNKKFIPYEPKIDLLNKKALIKKGEFKKFCLDYAEARFDGNMSRERFEYILNWPYFNHILQFTTGEGKILGYVFAVLTGEILHYWFSFYDLNFSEPGLGKWMMYKSIEWAKEQNLKEVYLGTCYGEKAMYKMRDFKGLEYFDGNNWNPDMKKLKQKCKTDKQKTQDDFKESLN